MSEKQKPPAEEDGTNLILISVMKEASRDPRFEISHKGEKVNDINPVMLKSINEIKISFKINTKGSVLENDDVRESFQSALENQLGIEFNKSKTISDEQIIVHYGMNLKASNPEIWVRYLRQRRTFGDRTGDLIQDYKEITEKIKAAFNRQN